MTDTKMTFISMMICERLPVAATNLTDTLQWRHDGHSGVLNHQPHDCLPALMDFVWGIHR